MNIIAKKLMGGGNTLSYLLGIVVVLCSAHIAQAAYAIYWKGGKGSEENPVNIYSTSVWTGSAGSTTWSGENISNIPYSNHNMHFGFVAGAADTTAWLKSDGTSASTVVADGIYAHAGNFIFAAGDFTFNSLSVGFGSGEGSCVTKKGGDWALTGIMYVGSDIKGTLTIDNGCLTSSSDLSVGYNAEGTLTVNGGSLESRVIRIGHNSGTTGLVEVNGGCINIKDDFYVGYNGNGTLTINGGLVEVLSSKKTNSGHNSGSKGVINLNGGVFKTQRIGQYNGIGTVNFNGGTLQANAKNTDFIKKGMVVNVNDGGGVIDCGGNAIKINTPLNGSGGLLFTGGSRIDVGYNNTYQAGVNYSGSTAVTPGTTLAVYQYAAANNILNNGLVIPGVPEVGQTVLILTRGDEYTFARSGSAWDNGKRPICPIAPETEFELVYESNIVVKAVGELLPGWYIGPADGNLSDAANWSNKVVPTSGNATILCSSAATLTVGDTFAPSAITFAAGSAPVAINGRDLTGIVAVTNLSSVSHTINAKVYFEGDIQVKQAAMGGVDDLAKPHVTFAGGAYAAEGFSLESSNTDPIYSRCIFGEYFLSNDKSTPWAVGGSSGQRRNCLADKSILHIPFAGNIGTIYVGTKAQLVIGDQTTTGRLAYCNYGEMIVSNLTVTGSSDVHVTFGQGISWPGVFKFNSVTNEIIGDGNGKSIYFADASEASKHIFYIGEGGVNYSSSSKNSVLYIGRDAANNYETIRPWYSDFTIGARPGGAVGIRLRRDVEFCTDNESGTGQTITIDAVTGAQNMPRIYISGSGTLKVNKAAQNADEPSITLKDTATLEYATATATLGTGTIALGAGTTFAFKNSGRELVLPSSSITLPSTGVATLRIDGAKIKSGDYTIATGVAADAADHLVIDSASTALVGRKASLRVDDGNLVLTIKSTGTVCIVR